MDEEHKKRLSERVSMVLQSKKENGKHVGRPARFMFAEDVPAAPVGRVSDSTIVRTEEQIYDYARNGFSLYYVAKDLGIGYNVLIFEMKPMSPDNPRFKGFKDRFSEYHRILNGE